MLSSLERFYLIISMLQIEELFSIKRFPSLNNFNQKMELSLSEVKSIIALYPIKFLKLLLRLYWNLHRIKFT